MSINGRMRREEIILGLDLAGSPQNMSGYAELNLLNHTITWGAIYEDNEILNLVRKLKPIILAIDAPLSLPRRGYMRDVDRLMHKLHFPVLPPRFRGMEMLTRRAMMLVSKFPKDIEIIEVHPTSTLRALEQRYRVRGLHEIFKMLALSPLKDSFNRHERDAILSAITGYFFYMERSLIVLGVEGEIVLPW